MRRVRCWPLLHLLLALVRVSQAPSIQMCQAAVQPMQQCLCRHCVMWAKASRMFKAHHCACTRHASHWDTLPAFSTEPEAAPTFRHKGVNSTWVASAKHVALASAAPMLHMRHTCPFLWHFKNTRSVDVPAQLQQHPQVVQDCAKLNACVAISDSLSFVFSQYASPD